MAKIHNPQDQNGIVLINQTVFDEEVNTRTQADTQLQTNIDSEVERATSEEGKLLTAIEDEIARAKNEEGNLNKSITDETARATAKEDDLAANITAEEQRATIKETELNTAIETEVTRATVKEADLNTAIEAEVTRATAKENLISAIIGDGTLLYSTDDLTGGTYSATVNEPSAINIHHSIVPAGIIESIEIPDSKISTPRYLNIKVVDGVSDTAVDYTSTNSSTTKWAFTNFIKDENVAEGVYYKLVLTNTPGGTLQYFGRNFPVNNGNFANCGLGGNWPNPNISLTAENGVVGLPLINFEYKLIDNVKDTIKANEAALNESISSVDDKVDSTKQILEAADDAIRLEIQEAKAAVEAAVEAEAESRIGGDTLINNALTDEITRATAAEENLETQLTAEIERASANELSIMSCFNNISGHEIVTPLANRPSDIVEATALEVKGANNLNSIVGRKVKAIEFDVDNTVSTPHYIAIYKDISGTKHFIAVSEATTWTNGGKAKFVFNTPFTLENNAFEIFLVDNLNVVGKPTNQGALPAPSSCLKIYSLLNEVNDDGGNYRRFNGNWNNDNGRKRSFYITYHFDAARLDTLESSVKNHKDDDVKHITSEERASWNAKPSMESINAKLEDYQLKSEVEESSDRYKFIPGDNSSSINANFTDIETAENFSGGAITSVPAISGNIGEQTTRFNFSNVCELTLYNPDNEIICSAAVALNAGLETEFGGMPAHAYEISYGEYSTLEEYGICIKSYTSDSAGYAWTIAEYPGYEGLRTGWKVSIGNTNEGGTRIQGTISGGQAASSSVTQATVEIPQNVYKVDITRGSRVETYTIGETFDGTLCTVNGNILTAVAEGTSGNTLRATFYTKNNQPIDKTLVLNLNKDNAKVITANAAFNSKQLNPVINDGTVLIEVTIESTDSSGYIILNTICDSTTYDNAQYVCHVVPVSITA